MEILQIGFVKMIVFEQQDGRLGFRVGFAELNTDYDNSLKLEFSSCLSSTIKSRDEMKRQAIRNVKMRLRSMINGLEIMEQGSVKETQPSLL